MAEEKKTTNAPEEEPEIITLEFDDGAMMNCENMGVFDCGDKDYIALIPLDGTDDVYLYRYQEYDDGSYDILDIDDDDEFKKVAAEFEAIMAENDEEE